MENKIKDTYEKMSAMDEKNRKRLKWTTEQVKVTALLLKKFYMEHNRLPGNSEKDNDFYEKMQNAVGRSIQCQSFVNHIKRYYKSLYTDFIMNGISERQPDIELNENAVKIFMDEFKKVRTAYEKLTGHKDFKIPVGIIINNMMCDEKGLNEDKCNKFAKFTKGDEEIYVKIIKIINRNKVIKDNIKSKLNNDELFNIIRWNGGGNSDLPLDTPINNKNEKITQLDCFKRNIICLCVRRELYKFVIQYCLHKSDRIEFEKLAKKLYEKVSGQEEGFLDEIKGAVSTIFNDDIISKPDNIQGILNKAYIYHERKKFKQYILKDMICKINSYMKNESQIEDISERLAIAYGLKENKVLKDGENDAPDYYDEELKGQLKGALNKLSNEINKATTKKQK